MSVLDGRFGKGLYTTRVSSKANDYSNDHPTAQTRVVIVNGVVLGRSKTMYRGSPDMARAPYPYDSVSSFLRRTFLQASAQWDLCWYIAFVCVGYCCYASGRRRSELSRSGGLLWWCDMCTGNCSLLTLEPIDEHTIFISISKSAL